jgi:hypothetical protein
MPGSYSYPIIYMVSTDMTRDVVAQLLEEGYAWIRVPKRRWQDTLRDPAIGRVLEILRYRDYGCWDLSAEETWRRVIRPTAV